MDGVVVEIPNDCAYSPLTDGQYLYVILLHSLLDHSTCPNRKFAITDMGNLFLFAVWYFLIWRVIWRAVFHSVVADERSDDEDDEDDGDDNGDKDSKKRK